MATFHFWGACPFKLTLSYLSRLTIKSLLSRRVRWRNISLWDSVFTRETHDCIYHGGNHKSSIQTSSLLQRGSAHANGPFVISSGLRPFSTGPDFISVARTGFILKSGAIRERCFHVRVTVLRSVHCGPSERSVHSRSLHVWCHRHAENKPNHKQNWSTTWNHLNRKYHNKISNIPALELNNIRIKWIKFFVSCWRSSAQNVFGETGHRYNLKSLNFKMLCEIPKEYDEETNKLKRKNKRDETPRESRRKHVPEQEVLMFDASIKSMFECDHTCCSSHRWLAENLRVLKSTFQTKTTQLSPTNIDSRSQTPFPTLRCTFKWLTLALKHFSIGQRGCQSVLSLLKRFFCAFTPFSLLPGGFVTLNVTRWGKRRTGSWKRERMWWHYCPSASDALAFKSRPLQN